MTRKAILLFFTILTFNNLFAQDKIDSTFQLWGLAFGDYFYKTGGDSSGSQLQYSPYNRNFNAFQFRRIDLGADFGFNKTFDARIVLEFDGSNYTPQGNPTVYVKDAWLRWKNIFHNSNLIAGIIPTPGYFFTVERFWTLRSIEKTIMDMRNILSSRDFGIMLNGTFDDEKNYVYYVMVGNGTGLKAENNKYKKFYGTLAGNFLKKKIFIQAYADYTATGENSSVNTTMGFITYSNKNFDISFETFVQNQVNSNSEDIVPFGVSFFSYITILNNKLKLWSRYDYYNSNTNSSSGFFQSFVTAGFDYMPFPKIHIMPNLWLNAYSNKISQTSGQKTDVVPRLTFFFDFR